MYILFYYILLNFEHNVISFVFFSIITARMNVIPLGTARREYEIHVFGERIERVESILLVGIQANFTCGKC
jgi:hypothetical protein